MGSRVGTCIAAILFAFLLPLAAWAQHPNVRVSNPSSSDPEEVSIAVNPLDPLHQAAGANLRYRYYSLDGGLTWMQAYLSSSMGVWGDPVVLYDVAGVLYYAHLSYPGPSQWLDRIVVQRSTDGGATYDDGVGVGLNPPKAQDKPGLATDLTNSPYRGSVYVAWTEFDHYGSSNPADSTRILFSRSTDHGLSWSASVRVSDAGGNALDGDNTVEGAIPAVGPEGQVYVAWSGPAGIWFDRSLDGGATFAQDVFVATQPGGWDFDVSGISRANGLPTTLCDISGSPYRGRVYVLWSDQRAGSADTDIFLARSSDGGLSWNQPVRVNDDATTRQQFFPTASVDPMTGIIYVVYYDRRATIGDATDVYLARSSDGGQTFHSTRVSDASFTPVSGVFFGDYIGIAAWNRRIYPIWMRVDAQALSVWTAQVSDSAIATDVQEEAAARPQVLTLRGGSPNPFRSSTRLGLAMSAAGPLSVGIIDVAGRQVATLVSGWQQAGEHWIEWDAHDRPAGLYFCRVSAGGVVRTSKLIVVR